MKQGEIRSNGNGQIPGFRFAASRLPCYVHQTFYLVRKRILHLLSSIGATTTRASATTTLESRECHKIISCWTLGGSSQILNNPSTRIYLAFLNFLENEMTTRIFCRDAMQTETPVTVFLEKLITGSSQKVDSSIGPIHYHKLETGLALVRQALQQFVNSALCKCKNFW
jgi:hypothetical protein